MHHPLPATDTSSFSALSLTLVSFTYVFTEVLIQSNSGRVTLSMLHVY